MRGPLAVETNSRVPRIHAAPLTEHTRHLLRAVNRLQIKRPNNYYTLDMVVLAMHPLHKKRAAVAAAAAGKQPDTPLKPGASCTPKTLRYSTDKGHCPPHAEPLPPSLMPSKQRPRRDTHAAVPPKTRRGIRQLLFAG